MDSYDIVIVGSGAGGGTLAHALSKTDKRILIIERGDFLKRSKDNWDAGKVFREGVYNAPEPWFFGNSKPIHPKQYYFVGGNTKFYGSVLVRLRERDFDEVQHEGGISPDWPITYRDLEPYYGLAEQLFGVSGKRGDDITEPPASMPYPYPPISHDNEVEEITKYLLGKGLNPFYSPLALKLDGGDPSRSQCIRCNTCDGYPCLLDAKNDADSCCVRPAQLEKNVTLVTGTRVKRLETDSSGRLVTTVIGENQAGEEIRFRGDIIVLSAGALNSALILLASASDKHPTGLANSSGLLGRNLMLHNRNVVVGIDPGRKFEAPFPKTFMINDFYTGDAFRRDYQFPLGNIQPLGKITAGLFKAMQPLVPWSIVRYLERHTFALSAIAEDLPCGSNRIELDRVGNIRVSYRGNNLASFRRLATRVKQILKSIGFPLMVTRAGGPEATGHQCGTTRFGSDPSSSVLDIFNKAHDLENLYVVDAGFFPSSTGLNPALTIMANALRVAEHIKEQLT